MFLDENLICLNSFWFLFWISCALQAFPVKSVELTRNFKNKVNKKNKTNRSKKRTKKVELRIRFCAFQISRVIPIYSCLICKSCQFTTFLFCIIYFSNIREKFWYCEKSVLCFPCALRMSIIQKQTQTRISLFEPEKVSAFFLLFIVHTINHNNHTLKELFEKVIFLTAEWMCVVVIAAMLFSAHCAVRYSIALGLRRQIRLVGLFRSISQFL